MEESVDDLDIHASLQKYTLFLEDVLEPKLKSILHSKETVEKNIQEFESLKQIIYEFQDNKNNTKKQKQKFLVNLGQKYQVKAEASDVSHVYVSIGLGFHVRMNHLETLKYIHKQKDELNQQLSLFIHQSQEISQQIQTVFQSIETLAKLSIKCK